MKLFVGLDVSSKKLDVCILTSELDVLWTACVPNNIVGAQEIKKQILTVCQSYSFSRIVIGMEATSIYSTHPALFFEKDPDLNELGVEVTVENPRDVNRFIKIFSEDKNDTLDAYHIADFLRLERFTTSPVREENYLALQRLTRSRYQLVCQMTETKQHFLENLYYKCNTLSSELKKDDLNTSVFSSTMISLMTEDYSLDEIVALPLEELGNILQKKGKGRFKNPEKLAKAIQKAIRDSYRLGKVAQQSIDAILASLVRMIRALKEEIIALEKAIEDLLILLPEAQSLMSISGVGKVYTAGILAEVGQIQRFDNQAKLAKYAGLYWPSSQSGELTKENTPMTHSGNHYLRYYLIEATNSVRRHLPEYKAYYAKKKNEVPKHQHKRALALTARKFVRLVDVLLRNHQLYTPPRSVIES